MNRRTFSKLAALSSIPFAFHDGWARPEPGEWHAAKGPLSTRWTSSVTPENAWREYPRPSLIRKDWQNLNGLWDYTVTPATAVDRPMTSAFDRKILVPFGIESQLSGVTLPFLPDQRLWYRRSFHIPENWRSKRVLLHFDAVDFDATIWLNGQAIGSHKGGYDRFTFEITDSLRRGGANEIVVSVLDPTNEGDQAVGKQSLHPKGASYTATSGIWQTVWLEPVPQVYIRSIRVTPDLHMSQLRLSVDLVGASSTTAVYAAAWEGERQVTHANAAAGEDITLPLPAPRLWSPADPFLYDLKLTISGSGAKSDSVESYFGMREITLGKDEQGRARLFLNGKAVFHQGPLDQGFWPDGIYTAPTDEALRFDLEYMKALGFNAVRKHVKIEPDRWYYWADKLGLLVWQDMPAGRLRNSESREQWESEIVRHTEDLFNHPSIVIWTLFNEGWGQYNTFSLAGKLRSLDKTRLINNASGWYDKRCGDIVDVHFYPGPSVCDAEDKRASVTGEFGGLGFVTHDHMWKSDAWGYQTYSDTGAYNATYQRLWQRVHKLRDEHGLSGAIYTQISDVETESNGILTYDRRVEKLDAKQARAAHLGLLPRLTYRTLLALSKEQPQEWSYTTGQPDAEWAHPKFEETGWSKGEGGFGTRFGSPEYVRTRWNTTDLWVRREFIVPPDGVQWPLITTYFGVDFELFLNGVLACRPEGFHNTYGIYELTPASRATLSPGVNIIAVHFIQRAKGGEQYVDVGLVDEIAADS